MLHPIEGSSANASDLWQTGKVVNERFPRRRAKLPNLVRPDMIQLVDWHRLLRDKSVVVDLLYSDSACQSTFLKV